MLLLLLAMLEPLTLTPQLAVVGGWTDDDGGAFTPLRGVVDTPLVNAATLVPLITTGSVAMPPPPPSTTPSIDPELLLLILLPPLDPLVGDGSNAGASSPASIAACISAACLLAASIKLVASETDIDMIADPFLP